MKSLKEKTATGLFWGALNTGSMQVLNIIIGIFLARLLSPADYGLVGMLAVFSAVATALQESGFTSALTNIEHPADNDYNSVFWFSTLMSVFLYTVLFFCAPLIAQFYKQPDLIPLSRLSFLTILLSAIGTAPQAYMFKNMMIKQTAILRAISLIISGTIGIVLAFKGMAYWSIAWQQIAYVGIVSIGKFFLVSWRPSIHIDFSPIRRMFGFSSKIMITTIISTISSNVLTLIFGRLFTAKAVGNFTQSYKWDNMANAFVSGTVAQVAQPVFASTNNDIGRQVNVFRKMLRFTAFLAFPLMFGLALVAHEFIIIAISDKWEDSILLLQILCISGAFMPFYSLYHNLLISHGRSDVFLWCNIAQIAVQIALVLLLYPFGILAMVIMYTVLSIVWLFVWQFYIHRTIGLRLFDVIKDIMPYLLIACLTMVISYFATFWIDLMLIRMTAKIVIAATVYVVILKMLHAKMLEECMGYLLHRKR